MYCLNTCQFVYSEFIFNANICKQFYLYDDKLFYKLGVGLVSLSSPQFSQRQGFVKMIFQHLLLLLSFIFDPKTYTEL